MCELCETPRIKAKENCFWLPTRIAIGSVSLGAVPLTTHNGQEIPRFSDSKDAHDWALENRCGCDCVAEFFPKGERLSATGRHASVGVGIQG